MEIFDEAYVVLRRPGKEPLALLDRCVSRNCLSAWHSQLNRRRCSPTRAGHHPDAPWQDGRGQLKALQPKLLIACMASQVAVQRVCPTMSLAANLVHLDRL